MKNKIETLIEIAEKLNQNNITWALGGSGMLYFYKIVDNFNDLDLLIVENDVDKFNEIFENYNFKEIKSSGLFSSKYFSKGKINDIEIDVIAGFTINENDISHYYPLNVDDVNVCLLNDVEIKLDSLTNWLTYYNLMGRSEKSKLISDRLLEDN